MDKGLVTVKKADEQDGLAAYRDRFAQSYQKRWDMYKEAEKSVLANPERYRDIVLEPPMAPNALQAYPADLFGLDYAKCDCRFEMIKIVREVGAPERNVRLEPS